MFKQILWITAVFILLISTFAQAKIVFTSTRDGGSEIYVMNDDGNRVKRLTHNELYDKNPTWSPDGEQIAFTRDLGKDIRNKQYDIFIMDADGRNQRNLTEHPARDDEASWSPDGQQIAFTSNRSGRNEIHIIDIKNGKVKQLTDSKDKNGFRAQGLAIEGFAIDGYSHEPCWSPDGKYIVYKQYAFGQGGNINIIDVKTKQTRQLTQPNPNLFEISPRWSPDGKYILYYEANSEGPLANVIPHIPPFIFNILIRRMTGQLVIVGLEGIEQPKFSIPEEWSVGYETSWSPDSKEFVFSASPQGRGGNWDIYRYNLITHEIINLTNHRKSDNNPNWFNHPLSVSPVGKMATQWGEIKK